MHRFKSAAETVRHGAEQLKPLGMNAGLGFAAKALVAVKRKPDRLRCCGDRFSGMDRIPWQEQSETARVVLARSG